MFKFKAAAFLCLAGVWLPVARAEEVKPPTPPVNPATSAPNPAVSPAPTPANPAPTTPATPATPVAPATAVAPANSALPQVAVDPKAPTGQPVTARAADPGQVPMMLTPPQKDTAGALKLVEDIEGADAAKSETAIRVLLKGMDEAVKKNQMTYVTKVATDLDSAQPEARAAAIKKVVDVIKNFHQNAKDPLLQIISAITNPDPKIDDAEGLPRLAGAINETFKSDEISPLIEKLGSTDAAVVKDATDKLLVYGGDAADLLANAVGDDNAAVKQTAANILKTMGPKAKDGAGSLAFLLDNDDKITRRLAATVLDNLGPDAIDAADDLIMYLNNDDKSVRRVATNILKKVGPALKDKTDDLVNLLSDDDKNTRALATELLIHLGPDAKGGVEGLGALLEDTQGNDADCRKRAARVLGAIGPDAKPALEILTKRADDLDVQIKDAIAEAIHRIKGEPPGPNAAKIEKDDALNEADPAKTEPLKEEPAGPTPAPAPNAPAPAPNAPPAPAPAPNAPAPAPAPVAPPAPAPVAPPAPAPAAPPTPVPDKKDEKK